MGGCVSHHQPENSGSPAPKAPSESSSEKKSIKSKPNKEVLSPVNGDKKEESEPSRGTETPREVSPRSRTSHQPKGNAYMSEAEEERVLEWLRNTSLEPAEIVEEVS